MASDNSGPAPFDFKQYGYSVGGPIQARKLKDKLFFFGAQEWVNYLQVSSNNVTVPTAAMRAGDFSELLRPEQFFSTVQVIRDPLTGTAVPGQHHSRGSAVARTAWRC